jgi:hypothetical protein
MGAKCLTSKRSSVSGQVRERLRVQLDSYFHFQRVSLSRRHRIANLLAGCFVAALQWVWRRLRGRSADEVALILEMYLADLKRTGREN